MKYLIILFVAILVGTLLVKFFTVLESRIKGEEQGGWRTDTLVFVSSILIVACALTVLYAFVNFIKFIIAL